MKHPRQSESRDVHCILLLTIGPGQMKKANLYGIGKGILSSAITLNDWWKKPGFNLHELVHAFGKGALQRGIDNGKQRGDTIPHGLQDALNDAV
jgi:hypothetical protein